MLRSGRRQRPENGRRGRAAASCSGHGPLPLGGEEHDEAGLHELASRVSPESKFQDCSRRRARHAGPHVHRILAMDTDSLLKLAVSVMQSLADSRSRATAAVRDAHGRVQRSAGVTAVHVHVHVTSTRSAARSPSLARACCMSSIC